MTYILIITLFVLGSPISITSAEFNSYKACKAAEMFYVKSRRGYAGYIGTICVPKGKVTK